MNRRSEAQLSLIANSLAQIYKNGIPLITALELVEDVVQNKLYKNSLGRILVNVRQGNSLSESFGLYKELYPELFIGVISIGEDTGKLYEVLRGLGTFYDKTIFVKKEIRDACSYPMMIFISMIIFGIFLLNQLVPSFCEIYNSMHIELPSNCKFLYELNNNFKSHPVVGMITIISWIMSGVILFWYATKKFNIGMFTKIYTVKLFVEYLLVLLFSIITSTGINISVVLEYCEDSINFIYFKQKIKEINESIKNGSTLTESLEKTKAFSQYTLAIVKIHEEGGTIDEGFKQLANHLENRVQEKVKKYIKCINPIFILLMSGFIISFMLEIVLPLFDKLQSGIK